ncbi:MAG: M48 family metalloprotease [Lachnospiraceae bacterium]|nr:M48 family metalloprotease [Lachnospiraceae bacterium]
MKKMLTLLVAILLSLPAYSHESCIPQNNIRIPVSYSKSITAMDEAKFNEVIDSIEQIYAPIFKEEYKAQLQIERNWEDETVNAYAMQSGKTWKVAMFGGLARHETITEDGFRAVVCHEVGHHIGGAVRKGFSWASNEGQADYFATSKCLKKFFEAEDEKEKTIKFYRTKIAEGDLNRQFAKKRCNETHSNLLESASCFRGAMAGQSLAELFRALGQSSKDLKFESPDPKKVTRTNHNHPDSQCRMDTYFQGALCIADKDMFPSNTDVTVSYCTEKEGYTIGVRPHCWYNPSEYEK